MRLQDTYARYLASLTPHYFFRHYVCIISDLLWRHAKIQLISKNSFSKSHQKYRVGDVQKAQ